jgi:hypothetical protein
MNNIVNDLQTVFNQFEDPFNPHVSSHVEIMDKFIQKNWDEFVDGEELQIESHDKIFKIEKNMRLLGGVHIYLPGHYSKTFKRGSNKESISSYDPWEND